MTSWTAATTAILWSATHEPASATADGSGDDVMDGGNGGDCMVGDAGGGSFDAYGSGNDIMDGGDGVDLMIGDAAAMAAQRRRLWR